MLSLTLQQKIDYLYQQYQPQGISEATIAKLIDCESGSNPTQVGKNYRKKVVTLDDGSTTTVRYVWSKDVGYMQVNDFYHQAEALKQGLDIYKPDENLIYGFELMSQQGLKPWSASKYCWSKTQLAAQ